MGGRRWRLWVSRVYPTAFHPGVYFVDEFLRCGSKVDQIIGTLALGISVIPVELLHIQEIFRHEKTFTYERSVMMATGVHQCISSPDVNRSQKHVVVE